mgnify:CR=1 FL=1
MTEIGLKEYGLFQLNMSQEYMIESMEYNLVTFDAQLALVGGYAAIIWQILSILLSWYQDFSFSNQLSMMLYTRDKESRATPEEDQ